MKRTFNFTNRRKIERRDISIVLREEKGAWLLDAELQLAKYDFPRNAEVWIEAHRQNLWMQFPWGTVLQLHPPADRRLVDFDAPDGVLFRVRVVRPHGPEHHKLVGEADGINFVKAGEADDRRRHLLEPVPESLGNVLWKLDFSDDEPKLLVNKEAHPSWRDLALSDYFFTLVYPEVLRQVLVRALLEDGAYSEDDDTLDWKADWVKFARIACSAGELPKLGDDSGRERWINDAVAAFANRHQILARLELASNPGAAR